MARNKRPALTSPWKIGFFVSLLLVAVGIGVGFFITRSFGLTWSWIEFHGTWSEFTFHRDAFMVEMLPMAGLVTVVALLAYLTITGAVRKYRRYLDSGVDYKRLIQSLSKVEDLSNEAEIRKLSNHPELRTFLLNLRTNVMERQKALDAREAVLADREAEASSGEAFISEVDVLVSAIIAGADSGLQRDLAITVPELKRVEQAIREHLMDARGGREGEQLAELRADLERSATALRERLEEIRDELTQSEQSARELETEVGTLRAHATVAAPAANTGDAERAVSRLDSISAVLNSLGEETRTVAINTALRASSTDTSIEGIVKLADDVRDVAAKFNGVAAQWDEASAEARQAFVAQGGGSASPRMGEALDLLSNKVALWAERTVILVEKVKTFEQHFSDALTGATQAAAEAPEIDTAGAEDWGLETTAVRQPSVEADPVVESVDDDFVAGSGFEKQEGLFSEIAGAADDEPGMFTDIPEPESAEHDPTNGQLLDTAQVDLPQVDQPLVDLEPAGPEPVVTSAVTDVAEDVVTGDLDDEDDAPNAPNEYVIDEEPAEKFHTNSAIDEVIAGSRSSGDSGAMPAVELDAPATATLEEEDVIDLYALGAVEYDPENIHHNA